MDYLDRALELDKNGKSNKEIAEILVKEGYNTDDTPFDTFYERVRKRIYRYQTSMLDLSKDKEVKEGKEERKPKVTDKGEYYIVTSGERNIKITKDKLRRFKEIYSGDSTISLNQTAIELNVPRKDLVLIKTAFSITHDDVPFIDEDIENRNTDELVQETLEKKKENYFLKLQQEEIKHLKKEVDNYRRKDYWYETIDSYAKEYFEIFADRHKQEDIKKLPRVNNNLMLEVPLFDLHLGKMAWSPETGENYDYKIAEARCMTVIKDVISEVKERKFEKIIFPIGQDFFNFDTIDGKTTAGTPQNNDLRWQKLYDKGTEILINTIEMLSQIAPVEAFYSPGNHDTMTSYYATKTLEAWFKNNPNVTIDSSPRARKYVEWGKCLIGFTHTDKEKKRIFGNMQTEQPEAWGRTKYREWHGGHLHSEQTKEEHGVIVRNLSSISGTDAWHYESGYTGAIAKLQCFIWDKEKGLRGTICSSI